MNCRVYPIRLSRNSWNIPIYGIHKCSEICNLILTPNPENPNYLSLQNIAGICNMENLIEKTVVQLSTFNIFSPSGVNGSLVESDRIVIPDNSFKMLIDFPLTSPTEIEVKSTSDGFSLRELIYSIKETYKNIYKEEAATSTPLTYNLRKLCKNCLELDLNDLFQNIKNNTEDRFCSICINSINMGDLYGKLICNHYFHIDCIQEWIKHQDKDWSNNRAKTCPMCRFPMKICDLCGNIGYIEYTYYGTVIPINIRGDNPLRNYTNGVYGIYGSDFDDLYLDGMFYDRIQKRLFLSVI